MNVWSIRQAAFEAPNKLAVIAPEGRWTYRALVEPVRAAAAALAAAGLDLRRSAQQRVMMVAPNTIDTIVTLLAMFEGGVPVMMVHPRSTKSERDALARAYPPTVRLDDGPPSITSALAAKDEVSSPEVPAERDLAVFFTSGTTGRPKAVRLSRRAFEASARASADNLGWQLDDRWLLSIPVAHVGGLSILTRCWLARRTVVLTEPHPGIDGLMAAGTQHAVTLMSLVPTQLKRMLPRPPPATVRAVLIGGAPAAPTLMRDARAAGWPVLATYGLTEACSQVTVQRRDRNPGFDGDSGHPVQGTSVTIRDGRIFIRGPTLLSGYLAPADGPSPPPPFDREGWFDTGDLGHLAADGRLFVHARRQDLILSGGENVYPREVEAALMGTPGIEDAVVFGVEDPEWGQAVAAVVVSSREDLDFTALASRMREVLAGPKRPRYWARVCRFPVTASGKIDRFRVIQDAKIQLEKVL